MSEQWDPYPGTIPASTGCKVCGVKPISHALVTDHAFVASWPDVEGLDPSSVPSALIVAPRRGASWG